MSHRREVRGAALRRLLGFLRKEALQIRRDPSSIGLALVMPVVLILLFGYGVSLDAENIPVAVVLDHAGASSRDLYAHLEGSRYFAPVRAESFHQAEELMAAHAVDAIVRVGPNFESALAGQGHAPLQLVLRGVDSNRARLVSGYFDGVVGAWNAQRASRGESAALPAVSLQPRTWFNPSLRSTNFLVPGLVALVMTLTGTLLTALVVAREWERGTMEAILVTPLRAREFLIAKIVPYYVLGMGGMVLSVGLGVLLFDVPLQGSFLALFAMSSLFLLASLGMGLAISSAVRVQFVAAQISIISGFLPAFFLSGLLFDLDSTPIGIRIISHLVPARYFVSASHTLFLAGDVWPVLWPDALALFVMAVVWISIARRRTGTRLDT
ncbi:MAG: ABC transporter permease [Planctomycetes bacterium]|nr:ABC transporter permease [Planctomycetota bacterium]